MTPWNFCTSQAAIAKAGAHANSTIIASGAILTEFSEQVEASINAKTRKDWIGSPPSTNFQGLLAEAASCLIGNAIIAYDPTGYLSREAETIMDVNDNTATRDIAAIKDDEDKDVIS